MQNPAHTEIELNFRAIQFNLRDLFSMLSMFGLWCAAALGRPFIFDVALITTCLLLVRFCWSQRRWTLVLILGILPPTVGVLSAPGILLDGGLVTSQVKLELLWSSVIVGTMIAIVNCIFVLALVRRRFILLSVLAAMLCVASVAMHFYSAAYYYRNNIDFGWQLPGGKSLRVQSLRGRGRVYLHWKYTRAKRSLNFFRSKEGDVFGQGGRVRGLGGFLTYLRSERDEGDHFFGPSLIVQLPYWMLATLGASLVIPWGRFRRSGKL